MRWDGEVSREAREREGPAFTRRAKEGVRIGLADRHIPQLSPRKGVGDHARANKVARACRARKEGGRTGERGDAGEGERDLLRKAR